MSNTTKKFVGWDSLQAFLAGCKTIFATISHKHTASDITSGTLSSDRLPVVPLTKGGTGRDLSSATPHAILRVNSSQNGVSWTDVENGAFYCTDADQYPKFGTLPIAQGGTGATTASGALTNLGITATATELNYVDGVTSSVQAQLDSKASDDHGHDSSDIEFLSKNFSSQDVDNVLDAIDYLDNQIIENQTGLQKGIETLREELNSHDHIIADVSGLQSALDEKADISQIPTNYVPNTRTVNGKALSSNITLSASDVKALPNTTAIPDALSDLASDSTHRTVTDEEKSVWNAKSDFSGNYNDLTNKPTIPSISGLATETFVNDVARTKVDKVDGKGLSTNDYTTTEKNKLAGIASGAEVNQNAFSNIVVGSTTISADSKTDSLTIAAGTGISVTPDATNDKITISNSGVRSISTGSTNGTISVNTNGSSAEVAVKGLGSAAYTASTAYDAAGTAQIKADEALASAKEYTNGKVSGLASTSSVTSAISTHNTSASAHSDIRDLITELSTRLNTLADSDDDTLDQMSEVVAYIKSNKSLIDAITTSKVNVSDIVDNLETSNASKVLSAKQGVNIKALIDALQEALDGHTDNDTVHITSGERTNWNSAYTHSTSAHAPSNAEKNQNAFSHVKVGTTTVSADTTTDTLTLVAGANVTITPDATSDKITISATDTNTTYSAGTGISLSGTEFSNSGVRSIETGTTKGAISVNTGGTLESVPVYGLGSAAYTDSTDYAEADHGHGIDKITNLQAALDDKSDSGHTHQYAGSSSIGGAATSANKVNSSLTVQLNGGTMEDTNKFTFNGSNAKSVNITPSGIGAASSNHTHDDIYTKTEVDELLDDKSDAGHTHSASYTPEGTVSQPTFNGSAVDSGSPNGTTPLATVASSTHTHKYTPAGTITAPTFKGTASTISATYTPVGSVSQPTFNGTSVTSESPSGTAYRTEVAASTHTHEYTPEGTISQPTFTGKSMNTSAPIGTTPITSIYSITGVGTLPSLSTSVTNRCLTLTFNTGSLPTRSSVNVASSSHIHSGTPDGTVSKPTFTGTKKSTAITNGVTNVASDIHTHSVTAAGTVSQPKFTGTEDTISATYTPAGTVSAPTFKGTEASTTSITGTIDVSSQNHTHSVTASGTVTKPTFTGTPATITIGADN